MKTTDREDAMPATRRKKRVIQRNTSACGLREVRQNGSQTCELCESPLAAGNALWGRSEQYLRRHLDRCETASQTERDYYKQHGKWPRRR